MNISSAGISTSYAGSPSGSSSVLNSSAIRTNPGVLQDPLHAGNSRLSSLSARPPPQAEPPRDIRIEEKQPLDIKTRTEKDGERAENPLSPSLEEAQTSRDRLRQEREQQLIQAEVKVLAARDREVRAHEQAHMAVGGQYAGAAVYQYERGPNGVNYAVGGEVPISTSEEATPEATLRKAQIIQRAALAPAEPSPQDRRIAAVAARMEAVARAEIALSRSQNDADKDALKPEHNSTSSEKEEIQETSGPPASIQLAAGTSTRDEQDRLLRRLSTREHVQSLSSGTLLSIRV